MDGGQPATTGDPGVDRLLATPAFADLERARNRFVVTAAAGSFGLVMTWLAVAGFTTVLDAPAIGGMTWVYVTGFAQFVVILAVLHTYLRRAARWDELADRARREAAA